MQPSSVLKEVETLGYNAYAVTLDVTGIEVETLKIKCCDSRKEIGVIAFSGVYPRGSAGSHHAHFISHRLFSFLDPMVRWMHALLIDFRHLHYTWGDNMASLGAFYTDNVCPWYFLIQSEDANPEVYKAYQWALGGGTRKLFTNMKEAIQNIERDLAQ